MKLKYAPASCVQQKGGGDAVRTKLRGTGGEERTGGDNSA